MVRPNNGAALTISLQCSQRCHILMIFCFIILCVEIYMWPLCQYSRIGLVVTCILQHYDLKNWLHSLVLISLRMKKGLYPHSRNGNFVVLWTAQMHTHSVPKLITQDPSLGLVWNHIWVVWQMNIDTLPSLNKFITYTTCTSCLLRDSVNIAQKTGLK